MKKSILWTIYQVIEFLVGTSFAFIEVMYEAGVWETHGIGDKVVPIMCGICGALAYASIFLADYVREYEMENEEKFENTKTDLIEAGFIL